MRRAVVAALALALGPVGVAAEPALAGKAKRKGQHARATTAKAKRLGVVRGPVRGGLARPVRVVRPGAVGPGRAAPAGAPATPPAGSAPAFTPLPAPGAPVPATAPGPVTAPAVSAAPAAPAAPAPALPRSVSVRSTEFAFVLSRPLVGAGLVAIEFNNGRAEDPHDLHVVRADGTGSPRRLTEADAQEITSTETDLAPGAYKLYCSIAGHEQLGMRATLRVEAG